MVVTYVQRFEMPEAFIFCGCGPWLDRVDRECVLGNVKRLKGGVFRQTIPNCLGSDLTEVAAGDVQGL